MKFDELACGQENYSRSSMQSIEVRSEMGSTERRKEYIEETRQRKGCFYLHSLEPPENPVLNETDTSYHSVVRNRN